MRTLRSIQMHRKRVSASRANPQGHYDTWPRRFAVTLIVEKSTFYFPPSTFCVASPRCRRPKYPLLRPPLNRSSQAFVHDWQSAPILPRRPVPHTKPALPAPIAAETNWRFAPCSEFSCTTPPYLHAPDRLVKWCRPISGQIKQDEQSEQRSIRAK